jgi:uncharacterized membrane protein YccC
MARSWGGLFDATQSHPDRMTLQSLVTGMRQGSMTALAAWISYDTSSLFGLREGYWAAISAIVVMQADLTTTKNSGRDRFIGTAVGGLIGWGCAACWHDRVWVYSLAVGITVFACWAANISNAGRLAAVAVTVIVLIPRNEPIWRIALFRFMEVSWGIAVALAVVYLTAWLLQRLHPSATGSGTSPDSRP